MNADLPIYSFREQIVKEVRENQVVVITAETGAGKSTQVPQYLHDAGFQLVITQPRRLAARTVAERVAEEMGVELGSLVGFRTAEEHQDSRDTEILFCTDGLQLVRELTGYGVEDQILVIDEVHEWNKNMEVLVAWAKLQIAARPNFKVVLMSATIEAEKLAEFFGTRAIISVPGKLFHVEESWVPGEPWIHAHELAMTGRNVLVFAPGKAEIAQIICELRQRHVDEVAEIIPLHGELSSVEQRKAFLHYARPKIVVSTNVAQTSVTIDDIDAVVDTGVEKRIEVVDGVEGLSPGQISQADCKQRKGRAGRTKEGIYFLCDQVALEDRPAFPLAEIMRSRLDQTVLRLAVIGLDATELPFFHQPAKEDLVAAREALIRLGAMDENGNVTELGRAMSKLPVSVNGARMIVEAEKRGVTDEILTIVACIEAGGIRMKPERDELGGYNSAAWLPLTQEKSSDLLAELDCYLAGLGMQGYELKKNGIHPKAMNKAKEIRNRLCEQLGASVHPSKTNDRNEILKSFAAGMVDHLYRWAYDRSYKYADGESRQLDLNSVIVRADWVTGLPFDLTVPTKKGGEITLKLLLFATAVEPEWLIEVAPQLVKKKEVGFTYSPTKREMVDATETYFNGQLVEVDEKPVPEDPRVTLALAHALAEHKVGYSARYHNDSVVEQVHKMHEKYPDQVEDLGDPNVLAAFLCNRLNGIYRVSDLDKANLQLELSDFIPKELLREVGDYAPEKVTLEDGTIGTITYQKSEYGYGPDYAILELPVESLRNIHSLPKPSRTYAVSRVRALDRSGSTVVEGYSLWSAKSELESYEKHQREEEVKQAYRERIDELRSSKEVMDNYGRNTAVLARIIHRADSELARLFGYWYRNGNASTLEQLLGQAKNEIERLSGDGNALLLNDLIEGKLAHPDHQYNLNVIATLDALVIRSGGFIEGINREQLRRFYEERLKGVERLDEALRCNLRLELDDYAPADVIAELELAPETIEVQSNKGVTPYQVRYFYAELNGERMAVGVVQASIKAYKTTNFPKLPHGIRLVVEVTKQGKVIARGEDDERLALKVKKYEKKPPTGKFAVDEVLPAMPGDPGFSSSFLW